MKKTIERQLEHHELMDWVESAETPEEMQERADHANAGYPVMVKEEVEIPQIYTLEDAIREYIRAGLIDQAWIQEHGVDWDAVRKSASIEFIASYQELQPILREMCLWWNGLGEMVS